MLFSVSAGTFAKLAISGDESWDTIYRMEARTGSINLFHPEEQGRPREKLATIHAVICWEDDAWCAVALELNVRSYGETINEAFENPMDAVQSQAHFSVEQGNLDQMFVRVEENTSTSISRLPLEEATTA